jgi:hypothetical protein
LAQFLTRIDGEFPFACWRKNINIGLRGMYLSPIIPLHDKQFMKACIIIAFIFCLFSCNKEDVSIPVVVRTPDSTIHLAGNAGGGSYWKNGVHSLVGAGGEVHVQSMSVDGASVVVGGFIMGANSQKAMSLNGRLTTLAPDGGGMTLVAARGDEVFAVYDRVLYNNGATTPISNTGWPTAMGVLGNDVYISGSSQGNDHAWGVSPFYHLDTYAITWKNGEEIFRETDNSYAHTIFIHEDDIYLGGHLNHYPSLKRVACYWKNGERFTLTDENDDAEIRSLFVTDSHVYAAGAVNGKAVYWKDGVVVILSTVATGSVANAVSVLEEDVYVAGKVDKFPAVWKNGVKQNIPNQEKEGEIEVVVAVGN